MSDPTGHAAVWQPRILSILRIMIGLLFMEHGTSKLLGFPPGMPLATFPSLFFFAAIIECAGSALIILGLFTRPAAFILSGEMAVAYFMVFFPRGFFPLTNGGDSAVLYCFVFFYLFVAGGGAWSLDRLRGRQ